MARTPRRTAGKVPVRSPNGLRSGKKKRLVGSPETGQVGYNAPASGDTGRSRLEKEAMMDPKVKVPVKGGANGDVLMLGTASWSKPGAEDRSLKYGWPDK